MANSLAPAYIVLESFGYGPHNQTLPINTINVNPTDPAVTTVDCWDASTRIWSEMLDDLVTLLLPRFPETFTFTRATLWKKDTANSSPEYIFGVDINASGTDDSPGYSKGTQETIVARDTGGNIAKLVLLDFASNNDFDKQVDPSAAGLTAILNEWFSTTNGWASRATLRPSVFVGAYRTLNEKLRRAYRET